MWKPLSFLVLLACSPASQPEEVPIPTGPNIVLIVADDLGVGDLGFLGGEMETPTLDRLANEGLVFSRFYSWALCSPSRAAILTGQDPMPMGLAWTPLRPEDDRGLPVNLATLGEWFTEAGYATACIGKWHLGHADPAMHPSNRGFSYFYGCLQGAVDYETHLARNQNLDWQRNGEKIQVEGYATRLFGSEAATWVREQGQASKPFFLYLPFTAPHLPLQAPTKTIRKYMHIQDPARRVFCAMVDELDRAVSQVLRSLEETGQANNTLIVFLSDNGAGKEDGGSNGVLRGAKGSAFEGGIRVPAFCWWPSKITPGQNETPAWALDIAPTFLSTAGVSKDTLQGENLLKLSSQARQFRFASRNNQWTNTAVIEGDLKYVRRERNDGALTRELLFNLSDDPSEKVNLAPDDPSRVLPFRQAALDYLQVSGD